MRTGALATILVCQLLVLMMMTLDIDSNSLSFVSTLVVVVLVAFTFSALLRNIKSLALIKNYGLSGVLGVIAGISFYWWTEQNLDSMVLWLQNYGIYFLMLIIFICALLLYLYKGSKSDKVKSKEAPEISPTNTERNVSDIA